MNETTKTSGLSVQVRLTLSFALVFLVLFTGLGIFGFTWYRQSLKDRLDDYLISEANSVRSALTSYYDGKAGKLGDYSDFSTFVKAYIQKRNNLPLPYETTLYIFGELNTLIASSNQAINLDESSPQFQAPEPIHIRWLDSDTKLQTIPLAPHPYRMITAHLRLNGVGLGWFRLACLTETVYGNLGIFTSVYVLILSLLALLSILLTRLLVALALRPVRQMADFAKIISPEQTLQLPLPPGKDALHQMAVNLNALLAQVQEYGAFQERFIQELSHELRTPLTILKARNEAAGNQQRSSKALVELSQANIEDLDRLTGFLNAFLALRRAENTAQEQKTTDLGRMLVEVVNEIEPLRKNRGVKILFGQPPVVLQREAVPQGVWVKGNPFRLKQVLTNLFMNSLQFTPEKGDIQVDLTFQEATWILKIANSGPPIPAESLERIFERFYRVGESAGFGLGLGIVKSIVEGYGGSVQAFNPPEGGAAFLISLTTV